MVDELEDKKSENDLEADFPSFLRSDNPDNYDHDINHFLEDDAIDQTLIQPLNVGCNSMENGTVEYFLPPSIPPLSEAEIESWSTFMYLLFSSYSLKN